MITIVADSHIPFLAGALEPFARMVYLPGDRITRDDLKEADGLIIRTRTVCNRALLEGTPVRFIATATIGFDHIDTVYCKENGISWFHAPGCNSSSVRQYIASALAILAMNHRLSLQDLKIGIVGVGNVGQKVARLAQVLGMKPLLNDPPREKAEGGPGFISLDEILETADIITLHVPLNLHGPYKTHHLAGKSFFDSLKKRPFLINTSRGPVVDTRAAKIALNSGKISGLVADVWENEPDLDPDLLKHSEIATPHIAGYSVEGKANGTAACVRAASRFFSFGMDGWYPEKLPLPAVPLIKLATTGASDKESVLRAILSGYDVMKDDRDLRAAPADFERLRNNYPVRREFEAFTVETDDARPELAAVLIGLGFRVSGL